MMEHKLDLTGKSDEELIAEYKRLMDDIIQLWQNVEPGDDPAQDIEYMLADIERTSDNYIKEITKRGIFLPEWREQ